MDERSPKTIKKDNITLSYILSYVKQIDEFKNRFGDDLDIFKEDKAYQLATVKAFERVGDLSQHLSQYIRDKHTEIDWKFLKSQRNMSAHQYEVLDLDELWQQIKETMPMLADVCKEEVVIVPKLTKSETELPKHVTDYPEDQEPEQEETKEDKED